MSFKLIDLKIFFRMTTSSSQKDTHFLRLAVLLMKIAPHAVRKEFDLEFDPTTFRQFLMRSRMKIQTLYKTRVLTRAHYDMLYPNGVGIYLLQ